MKKKETKNKIFICVTETVGVWRGERKDEARQRGSAMFLWKLSFWTLSTSTDESRDLCCCLGFVTEKERGKEELGREMNLLLLL